jgi:hypothetical protein
LQDFTAAAKLLEPLCEQGPITSPALRSAIARVYLQGGHLGKAAKHFSLVAKDPDADQTMKDMNAALLASADGEWAEAGDLLAGLVTRDSENYAVRIFSSPHKHTLHYINNGCHLGRKQLVCCTPLPGKTEGGLYSFFSILESLQC